MNCSGATVVSAIPYSVTLDTTGDTNDTTDVPGATLYNARWLKWHATDLVLVGVNATAVVASGQFLHVYWYQGSCAGLNEIDSMSISHAQSGVAIHQFFQVFHPGTDYFFVAYTDTAGGTPNLYLELTTPPWPELPGRDGYVSLESSALSTILVNKVTAAGDPTLFAFTTTGMSPTSFFLAHGGSQSFTVGAGSGYAVTETPTTGWSATVTVSNGSPPSNITVAGGETVTVTFTNAPFTTTTYPLLRMRRFMLPFDQHLWQFINRLEIVMKSGVGTSDAPAPTLRIRLSKDGGQTWAITRIVPIGAAGDYLRRVYSLRWGKVRNPVCEVCTADPVLIGLLQANVDYDVGTA